MFRKFCSGKYFVPETSEIEFSANDAMSLPETFPGCLEAYAATRGDEVFARVWKGKDVTFRGFAEAVGRSQLKFEELLTRRDRVAVLAKGTLEFYVTVVALQSAAMTPVLLNWQQPRFVLVAMLSDTRSAALVVQEPFVSMAKTLMVRVIEMGAEGPSRFAPRAASEAAVFFTSGTTGRPKVVFSADIKLTFFLIFGFSDSTSLIPH